MPPTPRPANGPYVGVATFCERVLRENDNVISVMRVIDQLNVNASGEEVPDHLPPVPLNNVSLAIVLRRGEARGRHRLRLRPEDPGGQQRDVAVDEFVQLGGDPESGANVVVDVSGFMVDQEGLWWFDVLFGDSDQLIARIPLRVNYHPQRRMP